MKSKFVKGYKTSITRSKPYIKTISAIMIKRERSIVKEKAPSDTNSFAACCLKSFIEKLLAVYLISSQCLSIHSSKSSLNDIAPIAKTLRRMNDIMQL